MQRRNFLKSIGLLSASATIPALTNEAAARPVDFSTINVKGKVTSDGKGIEGVVVTDGYNVVTTDRHGRYEFPSHSNAEFVYISVPSGYAIPHDNGIARFYSRLDKSSNKQQLDFALDKLTRSDDNHAFIVWGDTQIDSKDDGHQLKTISAPDTKALASSFGDLPLHAIACGDLVFDKFDLYPDYREAVATTGVPFFQLIGNHDMDLSGGTDDGSQDTFKSHFGPTYFSFNRGKIHYIVLDNVFFIGTAKRYIGYLTENQLKWLEKDLKLVPEGSTIVVSLHIPTDNGVMKRAKASEESLAGITTNRNALYKLLKKYKVHIMSGHTHFNENWEMENVMEHNHGTVCGAWWAGPICGDGTPMGYGVYEVNGDNIKWYYKSIGFDKQHQMTIHKKGRVVEHPDAVVVNVWNWDAKWKIEWMEDDVLKGEMKQIISYDPQALELYKGPTIPVKHKWVEPNLTEHLFAATPSAAAKKITVRATDRFGVQYVREMML
jgi:hypothetical protein